MMQAFKEGFGIQKLQINKIKILKNNPRFLIWL